jgi:hypothetical protein
VKNLIHQAKLSILWHQNDGTSLPEPEITAEVFCLPVGLVLLQNSADLLERRHEAIDNNLRGSVHDRR